MFSTCSALTSRAPIPDGRMEQIMQPWQRTDHPKSLPNISYWKLERSIEPDFKGGIIGLNVPQIAQILHLLKFYQPFECSCSQVNILPISFLALFLSPYSSSSSGASPSLGCSCKQLTRFPRKVFCESAATNRNSCSLRNDHFILILVKLIHPKNNQSRLLTHHPVNLSFSG